MCVYKCIYIGGCMLVCEHKHVFVCWYMYICMFVSRERGKYYFFKKNKGHKVPLHTRLEA